MCLGLVFSKEDLFTVLLLMESTTTASEMETLETRSGRGPRRLFDR